MARKRMIDPAIWLSEDFSKLSIMARLIWIGLISQADDEGRGRANPVYIKSTLFAYDEDVGLAKITKALAEIEQTMSITIYEIDGKKYYQLESWDKFQVINRPSPSQIPPKNRAFQSNQGVFSEYSVNNHTQINDGSLLNINIKEKENKERKSVKKESPTLDEIKEYARLRGRPDLAIKFYEYYTEGNWKDGTGAPVKNWKQKFITWCNKTPVSTSATLQQRDYTTDEYNSVFDSFKEIEIGGSN